MCSGVLSLQPNNLRYMMKPNKKMRKMLIKLQNQLGKNEGKTLWLLQKKGLNNGMATQESTT